MSFYNYHLWSTTYNFTSNIYRKLKRHTNLKKYYFTNFFQIRPWKFCKDPRNPKILLRSPWRSTTFPTRLHHLFYFETLDVRSGTWRLKLIPYKLKLDFSSWTRKSRNIPVPNRVSGPYVVLELYTNNLFQLEKTSLPIRGRLDRTPPYFCPPI